MKTKSILPFNWRSELEDVDTVAIGNDLILLDKPVIKSAFTYPFRVDVTAAIICIKGTTEGSINMKRYITDGPSLVIILPGDIMEYKSISEDFTGLIIVMSKQFTDSLVPDAHERLPLSLSVRENHAMPVNEETLKGMINYFDMLKRMAIEKDHPNRLEVARYLTLAFFYGGNVDTHKLVNERKKSHPEDLTDRFLNLVELNHREEREVDFYAEKLNVSMKHLAQIICATVGKTAGEVIEEYVTLQAKALLKSTNMTLEQISEELNFQSQAEFGKYFKRVTGMSPKEYKASK